MLVKFVDRTVRLHVKMPFFSENLLLPIKWLLMPEKIIMTYSRHAESMTVFSEN